MRKKNTEYKYFFVFSINLRLKEVNSAITKCRRTGDWKKAVALIDDLKEKGYKPDVPIYVNAMTCCIRRGVPEVAEVHIFLRKYI